MGGFKYPSMIFPNLVMNSSALRRAQNLEIGKSQFWPQNVCAVLLSHQPNFLVSGRVCSRKNLLEKKNLAQTLVEDPLTTAMVNPWKCWLLTSSMGTSKMEQCCQRRKNIDGVHPSWNAICMSQPRRLRFVQELWRRQGNGRRTLKRWQSSSSRLELVLATIGRKEIPLPSPKINLVLKGWRRCLFWSLNQSCLCAKLPHWWIRQTGVGNAPLLAALSVIVICAGICASLFAAKNEFPYLWPILLEYFLPHLTPHIPSTSSNHGEKTQYFRNRIKTQMKQEQGGTRNATHFFGKSLADSGLFFNVLMTGALERRY